MARLWQCGFELGTLGAGVEVTTTGGSPSVQSTVARTGTYALRINTAASTAFARFHPFATDQTIVGYQRFYLRIASLPSASTYICRFADAAGPNNPTAAIRLTTAGKLQLYKADSTQLGSDSATLSLNTWYRIELQCDSTTNPGAIEARLDGVSFASGSNSAQAPWSRILLGVITTSATTDLYFDDWALNDSSGSNQTSWPGEGKILHLTPGGDGDAHGWNNTSNGAGSATNYQLVDEIPPNDATDYVRAVTLNTEDMYALSDSGIGAGDTVNCVMVGMRLSNVTADATTAVTAQIKKASGGTIAQGTAISPNSTSWSTNRPAEPRTYTLVTYTDPDGAAWTQSTLDSAQAGVKITAAGTNQIRVSALWVSVDYTPSSGTSQPAGPASETDTAQAIGRVKARTSAVASETDAAQSVGRTKTRAAAPAAEVDTAQALAARKAKAAGVAASIEAAQPVARVKVRALGTAVENDAAQTIAAGDTTPITLAAEVDTARQLNRAKTRTVGAAAETDAAQPLGAGKARAAAPASTTETAISVGRVKLRAIGPAVESAVAQSLAGRKALALTLAAETDAAETVTMAGLVTRGTASAGAPAAPYASAGTSAVAYASAGAGAVPTASGGA